MVKGATIGGSPLGQAEQGLPSDRVADLVEYEIRFIFQTLNIAQRNDVFRK